MHAMMVSEQPKARFSLSGAIIGLSLAMAFLIALAGSSRAEELAEQQLQEAARQLDSLPFMADLTKACPADIMGQRMPWYRKLTASRLSWSESRCTDSFPVCLNACLKSNNADACFNVARVFENFDDTRYDLSRRQGFALACALGDANGCTNRGANIRNAYSEEDPFFEAYTGDTDSCLARSFEQACAKDSEWGCAMAGQALRLGEGVPVDLETARQRLEKACLLSNENRDADTERAPCRFAREQMKLIESRLQQ